jgi:F420H(2)-dependent quinone reductase
MTFMKSWCPVKVTTYGRNEKRWTAAGAGQILTDTYAGGSRVTAASSPRRPFLPPRWVVRSAWVIHRAIHRFTGGRLGLWQPKPGKWGTMRLRTVGRQSGKERKAILGYFEDGPNLVTLAMNGWASAEPAWWLNLQARPETMVVLPDGPRAVRARVATGAERERLWSRFRDFPGWGDDIDALAARRSMETAVVVLEPRPASQQRGAAS